MMLPYIISTMVATNAVQYTTNSSYAEFVEQDRVMGEASTLVIVGANICRDRFGNPVSVITNETQAIAIDPVGWGHEFKTSVPPTSSTALAYYLPGSLAHNMVTNIVERTLAHPTSDMNRFSVQDYAQTNFVLNPTFWLADCPEVTAAMVGAGMGAIGREGGGAAISPRHIVMATHAAHGPGSTVLFIDENGEPVTRQIVARTNYDPAVYDVTVALLDEDLPSTIHPLKVFDPTTILDYVPSWTNYPQIQLIGKDRMNDWFPRLTTAPWSGYITTYSGAVWVTNTAWFKQVSAGTSGHSICAIVGTNLVLAAHWTWSSGGPNYSYWRDVVNDWMHTLSVGAELESDYQLQTIDLSNWPTFTP